MFTVANNSLIVQTMCCIRHYHAVLVTRQLPPVLQLRKAIKHNDSWLTGVNPCLVFVDIDEVKYGILTSLWDHIIQCVRFRKQHFDRRLRGHIFNVFPA